jgi:guanylate kinase
MKGKLFIIAAPSGAGKTSLVKALLEDASNLRVSVSHTTRVPRPGEQDGVHYNFVDIPTFQQMVADGVFLEYAQVFDNYYGTSRKWVEQQLETGTSVILEIDWQGARKVREVFPQAVSIFILPPSRAELENRLRGRGQDDDAIIARRMRDAEAEISHYMEFDYLVVNDDFQQALEDLRHITGDGLVEQLRQERQAKTLKPLLDELLH